MKTIKPWFAVMSAALIITSSVYASGGHDHGRGYASPKHMKMSNNYHSNRHSNGNWVVPLVIGGVLGYVLSEPRRESVTYVSSVPVVYNPQPTYQEQWVYFSDCDCQRKVLVPVQ
ncbi:hypothetical protein [Sulfuricurvum sp.]|uniref:hypothetical protein n=1 Tax=Sulfuricurvum sp. TaxID=2025608 RepID=UPI00262CBE2C|nr:hypothetical protein [Sulfuricurvum sp.]MDD2781596.1 hypothetical protein [Sulfuricurvum sp.]